MLTYLSRHSRWLLAIACSFALFSLSSRLAAQTTILQPLSDKPVPGTSVKLKSDFYVPATPETIRWGYLPDNAAKAILTVPSGATVTFDTVSHEGILEDQGRDPAKYFGGFGIAPEQVLNDAKAIAASSLTHDFAKDGPHVVMGPVAIENAQAGDVLKVEMVSLLPRVPYGVISNRHGKGALPGEFPENAGPQPGAGAASPQLYNNVSKFVPIRQINGKWYGVLAAGQKTQIHIPIVPFMGTMGVAPNVTGKPNSIPPGDYGGNLDIHYLTAGATLYLPVQVPGAMFFIADPHFAQGNGEVSLTAIEGSLRTTLRFTILKAGDPAIPGNGKLAGPFAETADYWIPIGLDPDLNEAMKKATREGIRFLSEKLGMDRATAYAYLSAAADFEISQVVDRTKGVHALIRKQDFSRH
ncbi:MAG TPA: acetamidase/formamidase family protein [Candidatus Angelobacter sp.]|jgi:acetamidase/formamidase|nr:acetamidase/formamidase family protein [Candidatus Angelobacter sp.]